MVHRLYEEPEKDIIVGTFDNTGDIELALRQKKKKKQHSKRSNKKKLSGAKNKSILSFLKRKINLLKIELRVILITALVNHNMNCIRMKIFKKNIKKSHKNIVFLSGLIFTNQ